MRIDSELTDDAVLEELGRRLARTRLERNLTQEELADMASVALPTVQRLEAGEPAKLISVIRIWRALGLLEVLDALVPEPSPSPIELLKLQGKTRQRAARRRSPLPPGDGPTPPWTWGDDTARSPT